MCAPFKGRPLCREISFCMSPYLLASAEHLELSSQSNRAIRPTRIPRFHRLPTFPLRPGAFISRHGSVIALPPVGVASFLHTFFRSYAHRLASLRTARTTEGGEGVGREGPRWPTSTSPFWRRSASAREAAPSTSSRSTLLGTSAWASSWTSSARSRALGAPTRGSPAPPRTLRAPNPSLALALSPWLFRVLSPLVHAPRACPNPVVSPSLPRIASCARARACPPVGCGLAAAPLAVRVPRLPCTLRATPTAGCGKWPARVTRPHTPARSQGCHPES